MLTIVLPLVWNVVLFSAIFWSHPRPDFKRFDMSKCYSDIRILYDGEPEYRQPPTRANSRSQLVCWPKDGCWIDAEGNAICWRTNPKLRN